MNLGIEKILSSRCRRGGGRNDTFIFQVGCFFLMAVLLPLSLPAEESSGSLQGSVLEQTAGQPIPGIQIQVQGTKFTAVSNEKGVFLVADVPPGNYNLKFSGEGYKTWIETDVIVRSRRITYIHVKLDELMPEIHERVEVTGNYFHQDDKNPLGVVNLSSEEVRRAPGTAGGLTRMLTVLPGVTTVAADETDLVVRGGSPFENGYIIDNIEVSAIDHMPNLASCGGTFSALNAELIQNVDFFCSGFSSNYGGYLSSMTDISLREGNRTEFDGRMDISLAGAGFTFEGPVSKEKGSWLVTFKKSYLKLLCDMKLIDSSAAPVTFDTQAKITYDLSPTQKINLLYFHLDGHFDEENSGEWIEDKQDYSLHTVGVNWISNWSPNFFSNTSLAFSSFKNEFGETWVYPIDLESGLWDRFVVWDVDDIADTMSLRNSNYLVFNNKNKLEFGLQLKYEKDEVDEVVNPESKPQWYSSSHTIYTFDTMKYGLFFSYIGTFIKRLTTSIGARGDYSSTHDVFHFSPRFSLRYQVNRGFAINGGGGIFYQTLPLAFLAYIPEAPGLKDMKATHYSLGLELLGRGIKLTLEGYIKDYENLPISPGRSRWLAMDYAVARFRDNIYSPVGYRVPKRLTVGGSGYAKGIEFLLQKKLVKHFYGFLSASFFRSKYKDLNGETHNRVYDNRYTLNLSYGYKPNRFWEFSTKWTWIGGGPYTPYDVALSTQQNYPVYDSTQFLKKRYPAYSSLNLRVDKRFYFGGTSLTVYLDLWNALNRQNVLFYWWNTNINEVSIEKQLDILPILGVEFEF